MLISKRSSLPLSVKIILPVFIGSLAIVIFSWIYLKNHFQKEFKAQIRHSAENIVDSLEHLIIANASSDRIQQIIDAISQETNVKAIHIIKCGEDFNILFSSIYTDERSFTKHLEVYEKSTELLNAVTKNTIIDGLYYNNQENNYDYIYILPITLVDTDSTKFSKSSVYVQLDVHKIMASLHVNLARVAILFISFTMFLAFLTYQALQIYIFKPINSIKTAINARAAGDTSAYAVNLNNDEIGDVGIALNILLDNVENSKHELIEKTNILNTVIEHIPLCFFAKDVTDNYRWIIWNKRSKETFDLTSEQVIGKTDYDNFPKDEADFFRATDEQVMKEGKLVDIPEESVTTSRGTWIAHTIKVPVYDAKGNPKILIGILEDITERKAQQDALKAAKDNLYDEKIRLQTIMNSMLEGIIISDKKGIIQFFNPGAEKMFGYDHNEIIGQSIAILFPEASHGVEDNFIQNYIKEQEEGHFSKNQEFNGFTKNGNKFPLNLTAKNMVINNQLLYIVLVRDITEQKEKENELEAAKYMAESANALKSEFLSNMSHELRTPMHSIITFSRQGIERINRWNLAEHEENLLLIKDSGERLLLLLNDLLDLSKLEAGAVDYDMRENDLKSIVNSVLREMQSLIKDKNLRVELTTDSKLPLVQCDATKFTQVVVNFLSNAIKFTPKDKAISINITIDQQNPDLVFLTVDDEGVGIPENELKEVFDKFVQSSKTKSGAGGTGLGLAICTEIILAHGGKIWAENNAAGGARLCILIPIVQIQKRMKKEKKNG